MFLEYCRAGNSRLGKLQLGGGRAEGGCAHPEPSTGVEHVKLHLGAEKSR